MSCLQVLTNMSEEARLALTPLKLRRKARDFALKTVDAQRTAFMRQGILARVPFEHVAEFGQHGESYCHLSCFALHLNQVQCPDGHAPCSQTDWTVAAYGRWSDAPEINIWRA